METTPFDESMVADLEQAVITAMDDPTDRKTSMEYTARIDESYSIDVLLTTYTAHALPYGVAGFSHKLYLCHDTPRVEPKLPGFEELDDHVCKRPVLFSVVYSDDEDGRCLQGVGGKVKLPFADILALQPRDRELAITTGNLTLQLPQESSYEIKEGEPDWNSQVVKDFLRITSRAVANGVFIDTSYKSAQPNGLELFASYTTFDGDARYVSQSELEYPYLRFSVVKDEVETVYERSLSGRIDLKTRLADPMTCYSNLRSFREIRDEETGEVIACTHDPNELEALENEERASGLYLPTKEQIAELTNYASMLHAK